MSLEVPVLSYTLTSLLSSLMIKERIACCKCISFFCLSNKNSSSSSSSTSGGGGGGGGGSDSGSGGSTSGGGGCSNSGGGSGSSSSNSGGGSRSSSSNSGGSGGGSSSGCGGGNNSGGSVGGAPNGLSQALTPRDLCGICGFQGKEVFFHSEDGGSALFRICNWLFAGTRVLTLPVAFPVPAGESVDSSRRFLVTTNFNVGRCFVLSF